MKGKHVAILVAAVFFAGAALGYFLDSYLMMRRFFHGPPPGGPEMADRMLDRLTKDLVLSESQRQEIRPLIMSMHDELEKIRGQQQPVLRDIFERTRLGIDSKLTPDQRAKFDEIHRRMIHRFDGRGPPGPPPGLPPPMN